MRLAGDVKPQFGPTLPDLLASRVAGLPKRARSAALAVLVVVAIAIALAAVRGHSSSLSGAGNGVSFSFDYSGLVREPAPPGDYALLDAHSDGRLVARIALSPLTLPAYAGNVIGIEPLIAANYMSAFAAKTPGVVLQGAGPTVIGAVAAYNFTYTQRLDRSVYYGRVIFVTPTVSHPRHGLVVSLLAQPVLSGIIGPGPSALAGALYEPGQGGVGVLFQPAGLLSRPLATLRVSAG